MTGCVIGKWRVLAEDLTRCQAKARWICECSCGVCKSVDGYSLRCGSSKSCGGCHTPEPTNEYVSSPDGTTEVHCINGKRFFVDTADVDLISQYQWNINKQGYVVSGSVKPNIRLHRFLFGVKDTGIFVDHISGDKADNRRANLRICKAHENNRNQVISTKNTSGYKGVSFWVHKGKYIAEIVYHDENHVRHRKILGHFKNAESAAAAYDRAAVLFHGEFARTNKMMGLLMEAAE